jgi:hypothetical protein
MDGFLVKPIAIREIQDIINDFIPANKTSIN